MIMEKGMSQQQVLGKMMEKIFGQGGHK
ncbi:hypothetical protein C5167_004343 [Papaver somniferum]|uniref:Uncharacterized protein n=1 Tax=Papaver somniferum TaxID=3469 RepID=A0A4Y7JAS7_PAPSO|nr:hypothetical protein C5167_004343 [Papaver somniferum]